jgi:hypothetical protein
MGTMAKKPCFGCLDWRRTRILTMEHLEDHLFLHNLREVEEVLLKE